MNEMRAAIYRTFRHFNSTMLPFGSLTHGVDAAGLAVRDMNVEVDAMISEGLLTFGKPAGFYRLTKAGVTESLKEV